VLLVFLCGLTFFVGLGRPAITDSDEAFYAEAAREMVVSGDWVTPYYNDEHRFEKPILYYWLAAFAYLAVGIGEGAARFPSAVAGLVLALTTFVSARRWYGDRTGLLAGVITATSFGYVAVARQALPDLVLASFMTLATWTALEALVAPRPAGLDRRRRWWLAASGIALGAAFLTKGPVGIALPAAIVGPLAIARCWAPGLDEPMTHRLRRLAGDVALLAALCVVVAAPWFAAMTSAHGVAYLERFFIGENLQRFATERYNVARPVWYYLPIVVGGLLPWSPLMVLWCRPVVRIFRRVRPVRPVELWLLVWAVVPLLFFSISIGKQPRYVLAVLPPLAILLARAMTRRLRPDASATPLGRDPLVAGAGLLSGAVLCLFGGLVYRAQSLLQGVSTAAVIGAVAGLVLSGGLIVLVAVSRRQHRLPQALAVAAVVSTLAVQYVVLSRPGPEPVQHVAALVRASTGATYPYGRYGVFVRNLVFYLERPHVDLASVAQVAAFLASAEPVLGVVAETDLEQVRSHGVALHEVGRVSYLNTGNLKLSTLLWPDPALHLQTIVLVSNRSARDRQLLAR
jgi:4-amino-4-deoxy-L-arabinose transferase-like glycosyltransferase